MAPQDCKCMATDSIFDDLEAEHAHQDRHFRQRRNEGKESKQSPEGVVVPAIQHKQSSEQAAQKLT